MAMIERIMVRGTNWVGDAVITLPALWEIHRIFPQAKLSLLVKPWVSGIFEDVDFIDEVIAYDRQGKGLWRTIADLRTRHFDLAILFQNAFEAAVLAFGAGARLRMGFPTEHRGFLLTKSLKLTSDILALHQIYYYLHIVSQVEESLTGSSQVNFEQLHYCLPVHPARQAEIRSKLEAMGIDLSQPLIAINAGATNSRAKRWPATRFGELADQLIKSGAAVFFIGAASETEITLTATREMQQPATILTGKTSLAQSIALLSICDLIISNDTGPSYLAAALDRPTLTIFGPTDDRMIRPYGAQAEMLRYPVDCAPCMLRDCPIDHRCMTNISVEMVLQRARQLLHNRIS